jgi:hypothetical protein
MILTISGIDVNASILLLTFAICAAIFSFGQYRLAVLQCILLSKSKGN